MRSREGVFFSLVFPVILMLIFGAIFSGGSTGPQRLYAQNLDTTPGPGNVGTVFLGVLNQTSALQVVLVPNGQNFTQYLSSHSSSDGIVIPANFTSDYLGRRPVNVTEYWNPTASTDQEVFGIVSGVVNAFNLQAAHGTAILGVHTQSATLKNYKYIDFLIPGLVGFSILTAPMFALVNISSQYKRDKLFKQLSLTPLTRGEWLLSKVIWYVMITILSFILMTVVGIYAFGATVALSLYLIPFLLIGPFLFVSLGMLVGTASNSPDSAAVVGNLVTFPMMFLSGTFFPISIMPMWLQTVAHVFPLFYVVEGLNNVMTYRNFGPATIDLAVIFVIAIVIFGLAVRLFKWRED
ncbi:MAG TPA: ABC transporter permease [Nitrososphaerales archaeon]|nr:ABC transporter permease [Nitrososphaerales archaeon]